MEGFVAARRGLLAPGRLKGLSERSDARGWLQLGSHMGALALSTVGLALAWGTWWMVPLFAIQGVLLNFLYAGQHELSHRTVFRTRSLNEFWGRVIGFLVLYPRDYDRWQAFPLVLDVDRDGRDEIVQWGQSLIVIGKVR